jgi:hypothetical protein
MINPSDLATPVTIRTTDSTGHIIETVSGGFTKGEVIRYAFMQSIIETENEHDPYQVAIKAQALADAYFSC